MPTEDWLEPLHDAAGMRAIDAWAIDDQGVPSLRLMEAAGVALHEAAAERCRRGPIRIVAGKGNNGGDGLVCARHLIRAGHDVEVLGVWPATELSEDAAVNLERLGADAFRAVEPAGWGDALAGSGAVVDAIFGTGFAGEPGGDAAAAIAAINACGAAVVAADIPSGVDASTGEAAGLAVRADATVSFHARKLGQLVNPGKERCGELIVAPIGIPDGHSSQPAGGLITDAVLALPPRRTAGSNKFRSGQALIVGGSRGLTGAVCMAARAATRAGAGYATVAVPADLEPIFEIKLTEVMSRGLGSTPGRLGSGDAAAIAELAAAAAAIGLGPGLGRDPDALALARELPGRIECPLVIDADGLNAHAGRLESLAGRSAPTILTPHAGELGRLLERDSASIESSRLAAAREAAERSGAIVLLKGDDTLVATPDGDLAVCGGSSPALATAGTGDVLTGILVALLARGTEPFAAACCAALAHRRSGDEAARRLGAAEAVVAGDVIAAIPGGLG